MNRDNAKVLIAVPSKDSMPLLTISCLLNLKREPQDTVQIMEGSLIYNSRTHLANIALAENYTHVMWIDSDMAFPSDVLTRLIEDDKDIVTCICYGRVGKHAPCAYKSVKKGNKRKPGVIVPIDITENMPKLIEVAGCGAAMMLVKTDVYRKINKRLHEWYDPKWNLGEDLSFTERAKRCGYKIWCDTTIDIGHIGSAVYGKDDYDGSVRL